MMSTAKLRLPSVRIAWPAKAARPHSAPAFRPRVLVVAFQTGKQADGGLESLTQLLERLPEFEITVLSQAHTAKNERWLRAGCEVVTWPLSGRPGEHARTFRGGLIRFCEHLCWNLRVAWFALRRRVNLVHVNDPHALWHVAVGLRLLGIPVIYNIRDTKPEFSRRDIWKWRRAFQLTQAQIVLSHEMRAFWRRALGIRGCHTTAIYSVVDFQRMQPVSEDKRRELRGRLGLPSDKFVVGYVASFSEKKAQQRFIVEAGPLLQRHPTIDICFLGDFDPIGDAYAAKCARFVRQLGLEDQFHFAGYASKMEQWYPAFDAVVVATRNEGLARCMIESLACGTPVVSFDVCSARELLENKNCGIVVPQGNYAELVAALSRLAENEELRRRLGRNGAEAARVKFHGPTNTKRYAEVYAAWSEKGLVL